jgi:hypothetical protein
MNGLGPRPLLQVVVAAPPSALVHERRTTAAAALALVVATAMAMVQLLTFRLSRLNPCVWCFVGVTAPWARDARLPRVPSMARGKKQQR